MTARRIGAVRGARDNSYTAGVICAKVARYAERIHHPGPADPAAAAHRRRRAPASSARSAGTRRSTGWRPRSPRPRRGTAPRAVWPYYFAGTMGLVQRDGINRLRHVMGYSRQHNTICSQHHARPAGWPASAASAGRTRARWPSPT